LQELLRNAVVDRPRRELAQSFHQAVAQLVIRLALGATPTTQNFSGSIFSAARL